MPIYSFKCDKCEKEIDHLTSSDTTAVTCACGGLMKKQLSAPMSMLNGLDPSLPGAYDKWGRDREKAARKAAERRAKE